METIPANPPPPKPVVVTVEMLAEIILETKDDSRGTSSGGFRAIEWRRIPRDVAIQLHLLDPDENHVHIEDTDPTDKYVQCWNPMFWRMDLAYRLRQQEMAEQAREERLFMHEQYQALSAAIALKLELDLQEDAKFINALAQKLLTEKDREKATRLAMTVYEYELKFYEPNNEPDNERPNTTGKETNTESSA